MAQGLSTTPQASPGKHVYLKVLLFCLCALIVLAFALQRRSEPSFQDRTFSEWVSLMDVTGPGPVKESYREIVCQLGTNRIPMLLGWMRESADDRSITTLRSLQSQAADWLRAHHLLPDIDSSYWPNHARTAEIAFTVFDPASKKIVIKTLIEMLKDKHHAKDTPSVTQATAYNALSKLAPEAIAPLMEVLTNEDAFEAAVAASTLTRMGTNARVAIPVLEQQLARTNPLVRLMVARCLSEMNDDPAHYMPAYIQILPEIERSYAPFSLNFLVEHKDHASNAIPVLQKILSTMPRPNDPTNQPFRSLITKTIQLIETNFDVTALPK